MLGDQEAREQGWCCRGGDKRAEGEAKDGSDAGEGGHVADQPVQGWKLLVGASCNECPVPGRQDCQRGGERERGVGQVSEPGGVSGGEFAAMEPGGGDGWQDAGQCDRGDFRGAAPGW